jgi:hypothetical protein
MKHAGISYESIQFHRRNAGFRTFVLYSIYVFSLQESTLVRLLTPTIEANELANCQARSLFPGVNQLARKFIGAKKPALH